MAGCQPFHEDDVAPFLELAREAGWLCDRWEFEFLLATFPQGCFVYRDAGATLGYVTSIRYGRSGWIGNLLVRPEARRGGIGKQLMKRALSALTRCGATTVWLTASEQGAGLYRRLGFVQIDHINRWSGKAAVNRSRESEPVRIDAIRAIDRVGWGDRREALLLASCGRGRLHTTSGGFLCHQQWSIGTQIGPWGCLLGPQAGQLLDQVFSEGDETVFLDVPSGNFGAAALLIERNFTVTGSTLLMYYGETPLYQPGNIYALASMGSMG